MITLQTVVLSLFLHISKLYVIFTYLIFQYLCVLNPEYVYNAIIIFFYILSFCVSVVYFHDKWYNICRLLYNMICLRYKETGAHKTYSEFLPFKCH